MPLIKSAKKQMRADIRKTAFNNRTKRIYKDAIRVVKDAVIAKDAVAAEKALPEAYKQIDMAAKKHVLHKNTAARRKSLLVRLIRSVSSEKPAISA